MVVTRWSRLALGIALVCAVLQGVVPQKGTYSTCGCVFYSAADKGSGDSETGTETGRQGSREAGRQESGAHGDTETGGQGDMDAVMQG